MNCAWIAFGVGNHYRYISVHTIADILGHQKAKALAVFHAFTSCNTVSAFSGVGKHTAWETWKVFPSVTETFLSLANSPVTIPDESMSQMCGIFSTAEQVNVGK